jgi:hypothetical protein
MRARQRSRTLLLTLQKHVHFRERRERETTTYEFARGLIEDPELQNKPVMLTNVAPKLCNVRKKTTRLRERPVTCAQLQKTKERSCVPLHRQEKQNGLILNLRSCALTEER